ncbi:hypothetical protein H0H93_003706 [Arthromyces matolae]|nr:hypothetical protein H0H93_003706 [Arthromyces matolae]
MSAGEAVQPMRPVYDGEDSVTPPFPSSATYLHPQDSVPPYNSRDSSPDLSHGTGPEIEPLHPGLPRSPSYNGLLHPHHPQPVPPSPKFFHPHSHRSSAQVLRIPSEESRALSLGPKLPSDSLKTRGSMILYRTADSREDLAPPQPSYAKRHSLTSDSVSLSSDSKYPLGTSERRLVAYAWNPLEDPMDDTDALHDPEGKTTHGTGRVMSVRGCINVTTLIVLLSALVSLFVLYPVYTFYHDNGRNALIVGNTRINSTGQAYSTTFDSRSQIPIFGPQSVVIDPSTPQEAWRLESENGDLYHLALSDEFNDDDRAFNRGSDPIWEAVDDAVHDPFLVTTQEGHLILESWTPHISGLLRQRTPVCLDGGFIEISVSSASSSRHLLWAGSWVDMNVGVPSQARTYSGLVTLWLRPELEENLSIDFIRYYRSASPSYQECDKPPYLIDLSENTLLSS